MLCSYGINVHGSAERPHAQFLSALIVNSRPIYKNAFCLLLVIVN